MMLQGTYRHTTRYIEIFSCVFLHDYYKNGICNEIEVRPTFTTDTLLKNYHLIFRPSRGGFSIAADGSRDYSNAIFKDSFYLDFEFKFTNIYFHTFTDLCEDPEAKYFLEDDSDIVVLNQQKASTEPSFDRAGISGVLRIEHTKERPILPFQLENETDFVPRTKVVHLRSREFKLVYICYASTEKINRFSNLNIESEGVFKGLLLFGQPERIDAKLGFPAYKFTSKNSIPMRNSWDGYITLEKSDQFGFYKKSLPNPSPQSLKLDSNTNSFISENYVKL
ncbi:hypothetical protein [Mongoliibacter ruber]|uniref:Uncharacterized protein n=1 Tax=Mongoliibacter ruber TaxID=1750599 RepID=A0A2T0WPI3_9BACT|nr:hypothetical protein [Mongoliibacter ruber]PRY88613.1 hypothetical protein CLW00_104264 [Mongoliibacter ruber]